MIISPESFRNIKKRDYFPLFLSEYYKQCIYNDERLLNVSKKDGSKTNAYNIIGGAFSWASSFQGWAYWNDKYQNEVMRMYDRK